MKNKQSKPRFNRLPIAAIMAAIGLLSIVPQAHAACPAPPVGSANDTVVQMQAHGGNAATGPTSTLEATEAGAVVYDDANGILVVCDGTSWIALKADDLGNHTATQDLNLGTNNIVNVGSVQVSNDTDSCTSGKDGAIRYTGGSPPWEYCDGGTTSWTPFKQPRCQDDGAGECYLDATRSNDDPEFTAANIANGVNILGVTGTLSAGSSISETGTVGSANLDDAQGVDIAGDYAYVVSNQADRLTVIDISNPASPSIVGSVTDPYLNNARDVAVAGSYAFVVSNVAGRITAIDISNPASPSVADSLWSLSLGGPQGLTVAGNYAYVVTSTNRLVVVDISDPANLSEAGVLYDSTNISNAYDVVVAGDHAYVASYSGSRLTVVDISDPASPSVTGSANSADLSGASSVAVAGDYAYVAALSGKLTVVDISNPASPAQVGTIASDSATKVAVAGDYAYVTNFSTDSLTVIDISNPASPSEVDSITGTNLNGPRSVAVSGNYAYVASGEGDRLTIIDLAGTYKAAEYFDCGADSTDTCVLDQNRSKYDTDFKPENIADGVNILGVTGTLSAGGGCAAPASCPNIGDVCSDGSLFAGFMLYGTSCEPLYVTDDNQGSNVYWTTTSGTSNITDPDNEVDGWYNRDNRGSGSFPAFELCENNTYHGKSDWYLPARAELNLLWLNRAAIDANAGGNFTTSSYWSSTENGTARAWYQNFNYGSVSNPSKTSGTGVRCVRRD